jgi:DNA-binding MarR family transcriptional regulator
VGESEPFPRGSIIQELWVAARYGLAHVDKEIRAVGVTIDEYGFVSFAGVLQPVTRTRLSKASGLRRTTLRDVVARLIERGHAVEEPNPRDRRSTLLSLTPAGQEIYDRGKPGFARAMQMLDASLGGRLHEHEDSVRRVRLALQRLADDES